MIKHKDMVQGAHGREDAWYKAQDVYKVLEDLPPAEPEPIKYNIEDFNKEDWERLKKEWRNVPITVLPAQPEPKRGKWIKDAGKWMCDKCGELVIDDDHNFCPNCVSKMEREVAD